jgi:hypothetical protein
MTSVCRANVLLLIFASVLSASTQETKTLEPTSVNNQQQSPQSNVIGKSDQSTTPPQPEAQPEKKEKPGGRGAIMVVPLPISSPALGSGIVPVIAFIFPFSTEDKISPPYHRGDRYHHEQRQPLLRRRGATLLESE